MQTHFSRALRAYVSLSVGVTATIALLDPSSQHREAFEGGIGLLSLSGMLGMLALLAIAMLGLLDVVINDLLPERFSVTWTHEKRHVVFMLMAMGQVALIWQVAHLNPNDWPPVLLRYSLDALFAVGIAIAGVHAHYCHRVQDRERPGVHA